MDVTQHRGAAVADRAAGAPLGAAAAACMVGAPPATLTQLHAGDPTTGPVGHVGHRLAEALHRFGGGVATAHTTDPGGEACLDAWVDALATTVSSGLVPPCASSAPSGPVTWAWRTVLATPAPQARFGRGEFPCAQFTEAVWAAYSAGGDLAAMYAGALAGARWGASAIPLTAQRRISDVLAPRSLVTAAIVRVRGSQPRDWPEAAHLDTGGDPHRERPLLVAHPHDRGVWLANLGGARECPGVDAVVSLCRVGTADTPERIPHHDRVEVWLGEVGDATPNLHYVVDQAAEAVATLRAEGRRVLLHCDTGRSRAPAVAAHYAIRSLGVEPVPALRATLHALGGTAAAPALLHAVAELNGYHLDDPAATLLSTAPPADAETAPAGADPINDPGP